MATTTPWNPTRPASSKQVDYLLTLIDGKDLSKSPKLAEATEGMDPVEYAEYLASLRARISTLTRWEASRWISTLQALPWKPRESRQVGPTADRTENFDVPAGRYAVETDAGVLAFYRVDRPTEGRWAGRAFVHVQASEEWHSVRGNAAAGVLRKILESGPETASKRYGREIGSCGICGRTLTDENSRALGIGPVCAEKVGW